MYLTGIPEDALSHVVRYLEPQDFYALKIVLPTIDDGIFWWTQPISLQTAVTRNASLTRWVLDNSILSPQSIIQVVHLTTDAAIHQALYMKYHSLWPAQLDMLAESFIAAGRNSMFAYIISRNPTIATCDVLDCIYLHSRWIMMSHIFVKAPRAFIEYIFGSYVHATDPEVIQNLRYVLLYLHVRDRAILANILNKYHDWLWQFKLERVSTIDTIVAIHKLGISRFAPENYIKQAISSPFPDFLEYLILKGLTVDPALLHITYDLDKLKLLYTAQTVQKYQKILIMISILIIAIVGNLMFNALKIESHNHKNNHNGQIKQSEKILHNPTNPGWKFGVSLMPSDKTFANPRVNPLRITNRYRHGPNGRD